MIKIPIAQQQAISDILEQHWVEDAAAVLDLPANQALLEQIAQQGSAEGELVIERDMMQAPLLEEEGFHTFVLLPRQLKLDIIVISDAGVLKPNLPYQLLVDADQVLSGTTDAKGRLYEEFETCETVGLVIYEDELEGQTMQPVRFSEREPISTPKGLAVRLQERNFSLENQSLENESLENQSSASTPPLQTAEIEHNYSVETHNNGDNYFEPLIAYLADDTTFITV